MAAVRLGGEAAILVGLGAVVWWGYGWAQTERQEYAVQRQRLENQPDNSMFQSKLSKQIQEYSNKQKKLQRMVPPLENVGSFVNEVRAIGEAQQVEVQVPEIQEYVEKDGQDHQVNRYAGMREIEISITALGKTSNLHAFLDKLETGPYATAVREWRLQANAATSRNSAGIAPKDLGQEKTKVVLEPENMLSVKLMMLFQVNEDYEKQ